MRHERSLSVPGAVLCALVVSAWGCGNDNCPGGCPGGFECRDGECVLASACLGIDCPSGFTCLNGLCVEQDPCDTVVCTNPGEICRDGTCVSGNADSDGDGFVALEDCDDDNQFVNPAALEACNGVDDDCDDSTADGSEECAGLCCGSPPGCRECCDASQCGTGLWVCTASGTCQCDGVVDGGNCRDSGDCTGPGDCGSGDWTCNDGTCNCSGVACSGTCYSGGECCSDANCGSGESCSSHQCTCSGVTCSGTCYSGGDCCSDADCGVGESCSSHVCEATSCADVGESCATDTCCTDTCCSCACGDFCNLGSGFHCPQTCIDVCP